MPSYQDLDPRVSRALWTCKGENLKSVDSVPGIAVVGVVVIVLVFWFRVVVLICSEGVLVVWSENVPSASHRLASCIGLTTCTNTNTKDGLKPNFPAE